jgi:hypothetical protein
MARIFISYSRKDTGMADEFAAKLEESGHEVWIDRENMRGGRRWRTQIVNAIGRSDVFIVFLSWDSVGSDNVIRELTLAHEKKLHIVPILLEQVEISPEMEFQLAGLQQIDCTDTPETCFGGLLDALQEELEEEDETEFEDSMPESEGDEFDDQDDEEFDDMMNSVEADLQIILLGHEKHGKTTLMQAIKAYIESQGEVCKLFEDSYIYFQYRDKTITVDEISGQRGIHQQLKFVNEVIIVVSLEDGPMSQTHQHIKAAKRANLPVLGVFLTKRDLVKDEELVDLMELEMRELICEYGYDGDEIPVIHGSAALALQNPSNNGDCIAALLDSVS